MAELQKFTAENKDGEVNSDHESNEILHCENSGAKNVPKNSPLMLEQVRVVDVDGNLKVLYPSKTDLSAVSSLLTVIH